MATTDSKPGARPVPPPIGIRMDRHANLSVRWVDEPDQLCLSFDWPDAENMPPIWEVHLTIAQAVDLAERLVAEVGRVKADARRDPDAGPISSTF